MLSYIIDEPNEYYGICSTHTLFFRIMGLERH
jgi:hypothetical protein